MRAAPARLAALACALAPLQARGDVPDAPPLGWSDGWSLQPWLVLPLALVAIVHLAGTRRRLRRSSRGRQAVQLRAAAFAAAWITLVTAVVSPLDAWAGLLFSVHMVQHLLLVLVAAPLLVVARPTATLLWGLPLPARKVAHRALHLAAVREAIRFVTRPLPALLLHAGTVWVWHAPALYDRALSSDPLHALEHASFVVSGLVFFEAIRRAELPGGMGVGAAVLFVFAGATQATVLGALITFAPEPLYAIHAAGAVLLGLHPLADQQLAGVLMWVPANVIYVLLALWQVRAFLLAARRRTLLREAAGAGLVEAGRER